MPTAKDYNVIEKATIFDMWLLVKRSDKETYTKEELLDFFETVAIAKDQAKE